MSILRAVLFLLPAGLAPARPVEPADCPTEERQIYSLLQKKYPQLCAAGVEQPVAVSYFEKDLHKANSAYTLDSLTKLEAKELAKPELKRAFPSTCGHVMSFSTVHLPGYLVCKVELNPTKQLVYKGNLFLFKLTGKTVVLVSTTEVQYD